MKLAVYHAWIHSRGGAEKVLLNLLEKSRHDLDMFTGKYVPEKTFKGFQEHDIKVVGGLPVMGELFRGLVFTLAAFFTRLDMEEYDALVVSTTGIAEAINFRNHSKPVVGFCYSPLRIAYDPEMYRRRLEGSGFVKRQLVRVMVSGYRVIADVAWRFFDHVIFISETSRQRALDAGLIDREDTSIVNPGAEVEGKSSESYDRYFFYPSRFTDYKRQGLALEAYRRFRDRNPGTDFRLVLAGGVNREKQDYLDEVKRKVEEVDGAEIRSDVPGDEWEELYRNCYTVLFTAMNEDWGIIPLEAGGYEKPIISVDEGGPTESVVDGETGFLVDDTPEAIADAMERLADNQELAEKMGRKGKRESRRYTWDSFVNRFDEKVEKAVNEVRQS